MVVICYQHAEATDWPRWSNTLRIATDSPDEQTREAVAVAVDELLAGGGIDVASAVSVARAETVTEAHLEPPLDDLAGSPGLRLMWSTR